MRDAPAIWDHLIELFVVCAMRTFHSAIEFWRTRREHEERQVSLLAGRLEFGSEFAAAIDLQSSDGERHAIDQGIQEVSSSQRSGAFVHFQYVQRETMSRAEKCFSTTPRAGRTSLVSSCTRSPGWRMGQKRGFRRAHGRPRILRRWVGIFAADSTSTPRRFPSFRIRPTIEVESRRFLRRSSTTSLSFPQRGYSRRSVRTASACAADQVGWRRRCGRCERSSRAARLWGS